MSKKIITFILIIILLLSITIDIKSFACTNTNTCQHADNKTSESDGGGGIVVMIIIAIVFFSNSTKKQLQEIKVEEKTQQEIDLDDSKYKLHTKLSGTYNSDKVKIMDVLCKCSSSSCDLIIYFLNQRLTYQKAVDLLNQRYIYPKSLRDRIEKESNGDFFFKKINQK